MSRRPVIWTAWVWTLLAAGGCVREIPLPLPSHEEELVVWSILEPDSLPTVFVNLSQPLGADSIRRYAAGATVILESRPGGTDTLVFEPGLEAYIGRMPARPDAEYRLKVKYDSYTATAVTRFPPVPQARLIAVESAMIPVEEYYGDAVKVVLEIRDPPGENYYMLQAWHIRDQSGRSAAYPMHIASSPAQDPVIRNEGFRFMSTSVSFSDLAFDGTDYRLTVYYHGWPEDGDTVRINLYAQDQYAYLWEKFKVYRREAGESVLGAVEPMLFPDNIEGGIGVFGARRDTVLTGIFHD
ncbi:MAG: DUF4249 domain-containing protein [Chlorobi bacterium]|nr:DUF4249 domain-containing protein [Chlorobiota bacterium]